LLTRAQSSALLNDFRRAVCGSQAWFYALYFTTSTLHQACVALIQPSDSPEAVLKACPQYASIIVADQALYADFLSGDDVNYIVGSMTSAFASHAAAFTQASSHIVFPVDKCETSAPSMRASSFVATMYLVVDDVTPNAMNCDGEGKGSVIISLDPAVLDICLVSVVGASMGDITTLVSVSLGLVVSAAALVWVAARYTQPARGPLK
jgi:hypothetical protein